MESHVGRVSLSNSNFYDNRGNGVKAKLLDGKFAIFNLRETYCQKPVGSGVQGFPQLITGTRREFTETGTCQRVGLFCNQISRFSYNVSEKRGKEILGQLIVHFVQPIMY